MLDILVEVARTHPIETLGFVPVVLFLSSLLATARRYL